jgi:molecular chaperone GrpE
MTEPILDEQAPDEPTPDDTESTATPDPLEPLRKEKDALKDRLLRTAADFDNYRKRVERDRRELSSATTADVIAEFLPILDNFERALQAEAPDAGPFRKGIEMIHEQMLDLLRNRGVTPIAALGADFDPNIHQAVIHEASADHREGEVMAELQRGYTLGDRLVRPSMVKVAKPE